MNWSSLSPSPAVDAALRRAAAEQVMGWVYQPPLLWHRYPHEAGWWLRADREREPERTWLRNWNRDDLARVFVAASEPLSKIKSPQLWEAYDECWVSALDDPRAALCGLLDLLEIKSPEGLEA